MDIEAKIENYILKELLNGRKTKIGINDSLVSSGILDSLTLLQLISFLEEEFNIKVDDSELHADNFQTIEIMRNFVQQKTNNR